MHHRLNNRLPLIVVALGLALSGTLAADEHKKHKDQGTASEASKTYRDQQDHSSDTARAKKQVTADPDTDRTVTADESYPAERSSDDLGRETESAEPGTEDPRTDDKRLHPGSDEADEVSSSKTGPE